MKSKEHKNLEAVTPLTLATLNNGKKEHGVTLIALVVTIVILIILAAVSINMIIGDNGIITQAQRATLETSHANVKDRLQMKASEYQLAVTIDGLTTTFEEYLKNDGIIDNDYIIDVETLIGTSQTYGMGSNGKDIYKVIKNSITKYTLEYVDKNGNEENILVINIANLSENTIIDFDVAQKHPDQVNSNDIGIAEDGTPVNLDLWYYERYQNGTYTLGFWDGSGTLEKGYIGNFIDGKIIGKVPMYIKSSTNSAGFGKVISMRATFYECTELIESPKIPSSVEDMANTFGYCTNLKTAPEIPNSVTSVWDTFYGCNSLTGTLEINASSLDDYSNCLYDVATNEDCNLVLTGTCPKLQEIYNTKSSNSKITLAQ